MEVVSKTGCGVIVAGTGPGGATVARELGRHLVAERQPVVPAAAA